MWPSTNVAMIILGKSCQLCWIESRRFSHAGEESITFKTCDNRGTTLSANLSSLRENSSFSLQDTACIRLLRRTAYSTQVFSRMSRVNGRANMNIVYAQPKKINLQSIGQIVTKTFRGTNGRTASKVLSLRDCTRSCVFSRWGKIRKTLAICEWKTHKIAYRFDDLLFE